MYFTFFPINESITHTIKESKKDNLFVASNVLLKCKVKHVLFR